MSYDYQNNDVIGRGDNIRKNDAYEPSGMGNSETPSKNDILFEFDQSPEDKKSIISASPNLHNVQTKISS